MGKFEAVADHSEEVAVDSHTAKEKALIGWVVSKVKAWEDHRDTNYKKKWDEYYRLWRGIWNKADASRDSERSKIISPALQQAIESTVAEEEEAIFGKGNVWFDIDDDVRDQQKQDMFMLVTLLRDDLDRARVPEEVSKILLNGAIYGTGIGKIIVEETTEKQIIQDPELAQSGVRAPKVQEERTVTVKLEPVFNLEFAIDPAARTLDEAMGVAHTPTKPIHTIIEKQRAGIYESRKVGELVGTDPTDDNDLTSKNNKEAVRIIEYYGLVPRSLLPIKLEEGEELVSLFEEDNEAVSKEVDLENEELVEAIVTIANDGVLLRAVENKYLMKDRPFVVFQHDSVPGKFWGRGVAEKGYNSQKALDAELRARIDALALATHPMMAVDASRLPRSFNFKVKPGKIWPFTGNPRESFEVFTFGQGANQATFHQSGDLERMVQMGTGAMDSATPTGISPRNNTASGMSMMQSGFIKRSKRTMQNIERQFLRPLVEKSAWRYMQFAPKKYPITDVKFKVVSSMGIMAREYEQGQLTQLLSIVPPDSPVFNVLIQGIFQNSSLENKAQLMQALSQQNQPNPQDQMMQKIKMEGAMAELQKLKAEVSEIVSKTAENYADVQTKMHSADIDAMRAVTERMQAIDNIINAMNGRKDSNAND